MSSMQISLDKEAHAEINGWAKTLKKAYKSKNMKQVREASLQILLWMSYGTKIAPCEFRMYKKKTVSGLGKGAYGVCVSRPKQLNLIIAYLGKHGSFRSYLNTLIHEWVHHYIFIKHGDHNHGELFQNHMKQAMAQISV